MKRPAPVISPALAERYAALDRAAARFADLEARGGHVLMIERANATHATIVRLAPRFGLPVAVSTGGIDRLTIPAHLSAAFDAAAVRFAAHPALANS